MLQDTNPRMTRPLGAHRIHTASRAGEPTDASDDAAAVQWEEASVRAAVADGATESVYAGVWADILTEQLVEADVASAAEFATAVDAGRSAWRDAVVDRAADQPWYVSAKVEEGAFATALGMSVHDDGQWQAMAVGDCCLFHLRGGTADRVWPVNDPEAFGHRPALVSSLPRQAAPTPEIIDGTWTDEDVFLLATDAVAAWLLRAEPAAAVSWDGDAFTRAVDNARSDGILRNDDATLLVLEMTGKRGGTAPGHS